MCLRASGFDLLLLLLMPRLGRLQDWNYLKAGCFELTLELWEDKGALSIAIEQEQEHQQHPQQ